MSAGTPSKRAAGDYYSINAMDFVETTSNLDLAYLYKPFLAELTPGAHILDAGCGSGRDTKAFLAKGYRVTAFDASPLMAEITSSLTGQECKVLSFRQMKFRDGFDGIWACASLLHVPKSEMPDVMHRCVCALRPGGVFYLSLKEGEGERIAEDGRFFSYYTEETFGKFLAEFPELHVAAFWKTEDARHGRRSTPWLNFLLRKVPAGNR
jgi:SAM-dependent methyltransferase